MYVVLDKDDEVVLSSTRVLSTYNSPSFAIVAVIFVVMLRHCTLLQAVAWRRPSPHTYCQTLFRLIVDFSVAWLGGGPDGQAITLMTMT